MNHHREALSEKQIEETMNHIRKIYSTDQLTSVISYSMLPEFINGVNNPDASRLILDRVYKAYDQRFGILDNCLFLILTKYDKGINHEVRIVYLDSNGHIVDLSDEDKLASIFSFTITKER